MSKPIEPYEIDELEHSADVLDVAIMASRKQMESLCVGGPAFVMSYDRTTQKVIAQPVLRRRRNGKWHRRASMVQTPVLFPAGGGFAQTWDLKPGDFGFVLHSDDDPQMWLHGGGKDSQGKFYNRNDINYTFFLPVGRPFTSPLKSTEEGALWLGEDAYQGGGIVEEDARVGLRVKRGEDGGVELAREKEGEPKRRVGVTREGKVVIGQLEPLEPENPLSPPGELIQVLARLAAALGPGGIQTSGGPLAPPVGDPALFNDLQAVLNALKGV